MKAYDFKKIESIKEALSYLENLPEDKDYSLVFPFEILPSGHSFMIKVRRKGDEFIFKDNGDIMAGLFLSGIDTSSQKFKNKITFLCRLNKVFFDELREEFIYYTSIKELEPSLLKFIIFLTMISAAETWLRAI
ncbi:MAG: DUF1828 domain-containing protein [Candidatus Helarchaeota archaeon]